MSTTEERLKTLEEKFEKFESAEGGKKKKKKDPNAPKKAPSGYNLFVKEQTPILQKQFPEMKFGERATKAGELWKKLSTEEKAKYKPTK